MIIKSGRKSVDPGSCPGLKPKETVSFRWLKIRIIGHLISETINLLISETLNDFNIVGNY